MRFLFFPVESGLNLQKQSDRLGVPWWRTPTFLFVILGGVTIFFMVSAYFAFSVAENVETIVLLESGIAICMLLLGGFVIRLLEEIAIISKLKSDFISATSHKLKSPLAQIKWYVDLAREKLGTQEKEHEFLETLQKIDIANGRVIRMVDEMLNVARIDSGNVRLYEEEVDIPALLRRVCARHKPGAEEKKVHLLIEPFHGDGTVYGDIRKIDTVMDNLVLNALHYTERSGSILIHITDRKNELEVCVKDTGIGIPLEYQKRIFEKFFRADNALSINGEGSGLGLYLCQKIMDQMGGKIWFQSKEKEGSTFCVVFPKRHTCGAERK